MNALICIHDLSHRFGNHTVLHQINLNIQAGEIFGLLGPSGSGKTTLINILSGQLRATSGYATIFNQDTRTLRDVKTYPIGVMMEHLGLYERLSVYDNLAFYADIYRIKRERIDTLLQACGLYEARKTAVSDLSKGMKSRLALTRAWMHQPKVLFLDEPTSGLDPVTTKEIHAILNELKEKGTCIFLTTHDMAEAESLCDHIALLHNGQIITYGKPRDICQAYSAAKQLQITLRNGEQVVLPCDHTAVSPLQKYLENDMIRTIHSNEPTLEEVFTQLTGKELM